jgi:hypothetical protein
MELALGAVTRFEHPNNSPKKRFVAFELPSAAVTRLGVEA